MPSARRCPEDTRIPICGVSRSQRLRTRAGSPVEVTLPFFVEKEIANTEPGVRGDTATNVNKAAFLENGFEIQVPIFLNQGDIVKIDTRTGNYVERVRKA